MRRHYVWVKYSQNKKAGGFERLIFAVPENYMQPLKNKPVTRLGINWSYKKYSLS